MKCVPFDCIADFCTFVCTSKTEPFFIDTFDLDISYRSPLLISTAKATIEYQIS